jgi:NAD+ diphosphatase
LSFVAGVTPPAAEAGAGALTWWFVFRGAELLVVDGESFAPPRADAIEDLGLTPLRTQHIGARDGAPCVAAEVASATPAPEGHRFVGLRDAHARIDEGAFAIAGTASQVLHWDRAHRFCAQCGGALAAVAGERAKRCAACTIDYYPRIHPACIVLVHDGSRILMTRAPNFPKRWYALVAGFLEPGETLEACAAREVLEETGVTVDQLAYFGSQPWPFPHQVMVGFMARYAGGDVVVDHTELEDARWFDAGAMPPPPPPISIARRMIDAWLSGRAPSA